VIRSFDGKATTSSEGLQNLVAQTAPKKAVPVEIIRDKQKKTLSLVLGERPDSVDNGGEAESPDSTAPKESKAAQKEWLGAKVTNLTSSLAEMYQQPRDAEGVVVIDVTPGSDADEIGLNQGDVIRSVNQTATPNVAAFRSVADKIKLSQGVVLDVLRQGHPIFLSYTKE